MIFQSSDRVYTEKKRNNTRLILSPQFSHITFYIFHINMIRIHINISCQSKHRKVFEKKVWLCFRIFCVFMVYSKDVFIPITRRVRGYTRFIGMYVAGRRNRFRPHSVYLFLIRITRRVDLAMSVCPSVRMNAEISETIRARQLRFGMQIPELLTQRKFV